MREKLTGYSLDASHQRGGAEKARGFRLVLGITIEDAEYLASAIEEGILDIAVSAVRDNTPYGQLCEILIPIHGLADLSARVVTVATAWELVDADAPPRLVSAYIEG